MQKRFQVFVSSTFTDLKKERTVVQRALLQLDAFPAGMELFPAADDDQWTLIKKVIDESDYHLVIIAGRYGTQDADGVSYTEREYDYALEQGKPIISFLHSDPGSIHSDLCDTDPDVIRKLEAFREKAKRKVCQFWSNPEELEARVYPSYLKLTAAHPGVGWVRADQVTEPGEVGSLHDEISRLKEDLRSYENRLALPQENLQQGTDLFEVSGTAVALGDNPRRLVTTPFKVSVSWDTMFQAMGPLMFDEASEDEMEGAFRSCVSKAQEASRVRIGTDLFHRVKMQFVALGYIEKSTRKHTPSDSGIYWTLTDRGRTYLLQLSALRRDPA